MAWILAIAAAIAYALPALTTQHLQETGARRCLRLAWALHALFLGWGLLGEFPRFGFCTRTLHHGLAGADRLCGRAAALPPAQLALAAFHHGQPGGVAGRGVSGLSPACRCLALATAASGPGIASYGLFAAAVVHAALMGHAERQMRQGATMMDAPLYHAGAPDVPLCGRRLCLADRHAGCWLVFW